MTINKYLFLLFISIYLTGCSTSPYSYFGNPTLEQVLNEHAEKVQSLPSQADNNTNQENTAHLEQMYQEWVILKPKIEQLIELEPKLAEALKFTKSQRQTATAEPNNTIKNPPKAKYTLQIGASNNKENAVKLWNMQKKRHPQLLNSIEPMFQRVDSKGKTFYRIKIGAFKAHKQAEKVCNAYKALGGDCLIRKL